MLKQHHRYINYLNRLLDLIVSLGVWYGVFSLRFYVFSDAQQGLEIQFLKTGILTSLLTVYFFTKEGLYKSQRLSSLTGELLRVLKANTLSVVAVVVLLYFLADSKLSRIVMLGYYVVSSLVFMVLRSTLRSGLKYFRTQGRNLRYLVLIGHGHAIESYVESMLAMKEYGVRFSGWVDSNGAATKYKIREREYDSSLLQIQKRPDGVVIGYQGKDVAKVEGILRDLHNDVVPIVVLPDLSYSLIGCQIDYLAGVPALIVNQPNFTTLDIFLKRLFDFVLSGMGLFVLSPFLALIGLLVRLSSPGPIFYGQERVGLDGQKFKMWKFRSMKVGADNSSGVPGWTVANDPRRTKIGTFLRSTSMDELPQLWNVFVGEMSLIGPRPEQPYYVEKFRNEIPAYMLRHKMKAGITGWAQVNGWRGDTSLHKRIECDLYYIRNWSIWLDVKILFMTLWSGLFNKNAY
jgi:Undecaprenyl-phosphate glucose phosphotransferase